MNAQKRIVIFFHSKPSFVRKNSYLLNILNPNQQKKNKKRRKAIIKERSFESRHIFFNFEFFLTGAACFDIFKTHYVKSIQCLYVY